MVDDEIVAAGVKNKRVIEAMRNTPRHEFISIGQRKNAYFDMALPIGEGQTISPPFIVAYMTEAIDPQPGDKVLEIGTGSGYQAAVLAKLVSEVYTIEIVASLGRKAEKTLAKLHYNNVHVKVGDGYLGWPEHAPFDKIIVTCSPENVPSALIDQLKDGGMMVIPCGERYQQTLYLLKKIKGKLAAEPLQPVLFVPMTGKAEAQRRSCPIPRGRRSKTEASRASPAILPLPPAGITSGNWKWSRTKTPPKARITSCSRTPRPTAAVRHCRGFPSTAARSFSCVFRHGSAAATFGRARTGSGPPSSSISTTKSGR